MAALEWAPWLRFGLWLVLLTASGAMLLWFWRRWRTHQRGVVTAVPLALALLLAVGGMVCGGAFAGDQLRYGSSQSWGGQTGYPRFEASHALQIYQDDVASRMPGVAAHRMARTEEELGRITPTIYPLKESGAGAGFLVTFARSGRLRLYAEPMRALCVLLKIDGVPVRNANGTLLAADLSKLEPIGAVGWSETAMKANMGSPVRVRALPAPLRPDRHVRLEWALVILGGDDQSYLLERFADDVVVSQAEVVLP
ncbi:MAG: hypothetical protein U0636_05590 [Phycisphaerales bacterium]